MSQLMQQIIARAQQNKQRIVLPESLEERTLTAADMSLRDGLAEIILIGNPDEIFALGEKLGLTNLDKAIIIDPATSEKTEEWATRSVVPPKKWNRLMMVSCTIRQKIHTRAYRLHFRISVRCFWVR